MVAIARRGAASSTKEDEKPTGRRNGRRGSAARATSSSSGWGAYEENRRNTSAFNEKFKPKEDVETLIKIMNDGPISVYLQHWVDEAREGEKKSYTCWKSHPDTDGEECPLDEIGDKPSTQTLFNVLNLGPAGKKNRPTIETWHITSVNVADQIKRLSESKRTSPLNREDLYWIVRWTKGNRKVVWDIEPVKGEDLEEAGWDIKPFTEEELETFAEDCITDITGFTQPDSYEDLEKVIEKYDL